MTKKGFATVLIQYAIYLYFKAFTFSCFSRNSTRKGISISNIFQEPFEPQILFLYHFIEYETLILVIQSGCGNSGNFNTKNVFCISDI